MSSDTLIEEATDRQRTQLSSTSSTSKQTSSQSALDRIRPPQPVTADERSTRPSKENANSAESPLQPPPPDLSPMLFPAEGDIIFPGDFRRRKRAQSNKGIEIELQPLGQSPDFAPQILDEWRFQICEDKEEEEEQQAIELQYFRNPGSTQQEQQLDGQSRTGEIFPQHSAWPGDECTSQLCQSSSASPQDSF